MPNRGNDRALGVVPICHGELCRQGHWVNRKRVQRRMQTMGLRAIYRRPKTSQPGPGHKVYPYLLGAMAITRPNQVWVYIRKMPILQAS